MPTLATSHAGAWLLLAIVVAVVAIDGWLYFSGRPTMSQVVLRATRGRPWWKAFGMGVIGITLWHLFFGGPL